jgi:pimeloyl-ACP methyl ester carboxylesterase
MMLQHRRYEDSLAGITEEFLQPTFGLGRTIGVLSRPLRPALPVGWVLCHSFGMEQIHLARLDVLVARELSRAGFQVLRFHGQGYGDSESGMEVVGLDSHLAEAADAVELMRGLEGIENVGVLGARFGGTVAALVAERLGLGLMGLWEPAVKGSQYMAGLLRGQLLSDIVESGQGGGAAELEHIRRDLGSRGWTDLRGFRLSKKTYDEIAAVDLTKDLTNFSGAALLVALSRSGKASPGLTALSHHLSGLGAACALEMIQDAAAPQFGQPRWRTVEGGQGKRDTQLELDEKIVATTEAWVASQRHSSTPALRTQP